MKSIRFDEIRIPDSALAGDAVALATEALPPTLVAHSIRSFVLGSAFGLMRELSFDVEALYVASMLHDVGLGASFSGERAFELEGADAAAQLMAKHDDARATSVWDAIAMHTVPHLAQSRDAETLLVHLGSGCDVFGARIDSLPRDFVAEVFARYPRTTFAEEIDAAMERVAKRHPVSQFAAFRALGLRPFN